MNPQKKQPPRVPQTKPPAQPTGKSTTEAKKSLNVDLNDLLPKIKKLSQKLVAHLPFIAVMFVLLIYLLVVWQIRDLVATEPSPEDESLALSSTHIPKIDKDAIEAIQSLEQSNPQVKTLLEEARKNPFHE